MQGFRGKLASFLWWTYPRGSLQYDVMVGLILAFIFLTPRSFFRDQPRPPAAPPFESILLPAVRPAHPVLPLKIIVVPPQYGRERQA